MTILELAKRWQSPEGLLVTREVVRFLAGERRWLPTDVGDHEGRRDLRGFAVPTRQDLDEIATARTRWNWQSGNIEAHAVEWCGLDLSGARIHGVRLFDARIDDCKFDGGSLSDLRLWNSEVRVSSFVGCDLREAAIGTWHDGRGNAWHQVSFDRADLRGALAFGCLLEGCSFAGTKLSGAEFQQAKIRDCQFSGKLRDVLFDGRSLPGKPDPAPLQRVNFGAAKFEDVEFRGCQFDDVTLPEGTHVIPHFPAVARRALEALGHDDSLEARVMRAELANGLRWPGAEDSVEVFNRHDYVRSGGERLAHLAETLFARAAQDLA